MLIELILTIAAWRKGWGPIALIPMAVGFTIGVIGSGMANSLVPAVMADLLIYAALITMIIAGRKKAAVQPLVAATVTQVPSPAATYAAPTYSAYQCADINSLHRNG